MKYKTAHAYGSSLPAFSPYFSSPVPEFLALLRELLKGFTLCLLAGTFADKAKIRTQSRLFLTPARDFTIRDIERLAILTIAQVQRRMDLCLCQHILECICVLALPPSLGTWERHTCPLHRGRRGGYSDTVPSLVLRS
jgi:hypothetical protein